MPSILEGVFSSSEDELNKMLVSLVGMPKDQIESELSAIKSRVEEVAQTIPTKGNKGDKGDKGDQGIQGPKGEPGRDGRDGFIGKDGKQGVAGQDGKDGKDGVSIVDVNVAFDNHLVITLSDGTEIDAGVIGSLNENLQNVVANYVSNGANGTLIYKGLWNASTNTPTLSLSSSDAGAYYVVSVAGSTNLSGITDWQVNDWAIFNGTAWQKIDNSDLFNPSAVAITGGAIDGTTIGSTTASTGKFTSVTTPSVTASSTDLTLSAISTGAVKFNTPNGQQVQISDSGVVPSRYIDLSNGSAASRIVSVPSTGSSDLNISAFGTSGNVRFFTNNLGQEQLRVSHTASAVNYVQVTGAATGNAAGPLITAQGSDASIPLSLQSKLNSPINFFTSGGYQQFKVNNLVNAVNYAQVQGSIATNAVPYTVAGSDTNISMAFQPKGTGAIDLAAGSSGVNISNGGTVTAVTRTASGTGYTSFPTVAVSAPTTAGGVQATILMPYMFVTGGTVASGGTGYTVGDTLTMSGGTPQTVAGTLTVSSVSGGVITGLSGGNFANYSVLPTNPISMTGGTGTGASINVTYGVSSTGFAVNNAGSGYIEQPTVTFSGGGGSGASAYATVGSATVVRCLGTNIDFYVPSSIASASPALRIADGGSSTIYPQINNFGSTVNILAAGATNTTLLLGSNGTNHVTLSTNGTSRVEQLRVSHTASAVNFVQVTGAVTSGSPTISAQGSDANIPLNIRSKGVFNINFQNGNNNNGLVVDMTSGGTLANYVAIAGKVTGSAPTISALGTDTNIDLSLTTKGTGAVNLNTGGGTQFQVTNTASANNYFATTGSNGGSPALYSVGASANIGANIVSKGTGSVAMFTNGGVTQLVASHTASAVNYVQVTGSATTLNPTISAQGSDTNISLALTPKGTGLIQLNSATNIGRSSTNWVQAAGSSTGVAVGFTALGGDTNIDLALTPKGTGVVQFGTHTANADTAISGYITIRDAGGTLRKLAVIT